MFQSADRRQAHPKTRQEVTMKQRRVAVIGTSTIGASWAATFLARGLEVAAYDPAPEGEGFARRFIDNAWGALDRLGLVVADGSPERISFHSDPAAAVAGAEFVQESGPEREDVKIALFAELDAAMAPDAVLASSSSGLLISRLQSRCRHPHRCVLGHPFNPPHLIPLVEVVGGESTSADAIAAAMDFYRSRQSAPHAASEAGDHRWRR
jgi:carnitine 3-dehydrogenase